MFVNGSKYQVFGDSFPDIFILADIRKPKIICSGSRFNPWHFLQEKTISLSWNIYYRFENEYGDIHKAKTEIFVELRKVRKTMYGPEIIKWSCLGRKFSAVSWNQFASVFTKFHLKPNFMKVNTIIRHGIQNYNNFWGLISKFLVFQWQLDNPVRMSERLNRRLPLKLGDKNRKPRSSIIRLWEVYW